MFEDDGCGNGSGCGTDDGPWTKDDCGPRDLSWRDWWRRALVAAGGCFGCGNKDRGGTKTPRWRRVTPHNKYKIYKEIWLYIFVYIYIYIYICIYIFIFIFETYIHVYIYTYMFVYFKNIKTHGNDVQSSNICFSNLFSLLAGDWFDGSLNFVSPPLESLLVIKISVQIIE